MTSPVNFNTFERVIQEAYENCALIAVGTRPNSEQLARGMNKLNSLVNFWQTKGLKLFTMVDTTLPLLATINYYPLGIGQSGINMTKPLRVDYAYFLSTSGNRVPLTVLSWQEWTILPVNSTAPGQPTSYFVDKQETYLGVYLWPAPDTTAITGTVHLVLQTQIPSGVSLTSDTAFPAEWFMTLSWGLAEELSVGQPQSIVANCKERSLYYRTEAENWDVEDAQTFLSPDPRSTYYGSSFQ
jgi:hypothetical protein